MFSTHVVDTPMMRASPYYQVRSEKGFLVVSVFVRLLNSRSSLLFVCGEELQVCGAINGAVIPADYLPF